MKKGKIWVEVERCTACRTCELACAVEHSVSKTLEGAISEEPRPETRLKVEKAGNFAMPIHCRHCEDAPCVAVCPTNALTKSERFGPVLLETDKCIGCTFCIQACPFGVIRMSQSGKKVAIKCDLCVERLKRGELPACVVSCPTKTMEFLSEDDYAQKVRGKTAERMAADHLATKEAI